MEATREIPLTKGYVAIVDEDDYEAVVAMGKWCVKETASGPYAVRGCALPSGKRGIIPLHKFLTGWERTDHINGDGLDNRRANLRPVTVAQNGQNSGRSRRNTSGYKGVTAHKGGWIALVGIGGGKQRYLGKFATREEAGRAYDAAAIQLYGEYARPNFPTVAEAS